MAGTNTVPILLAPRPKEPTQARNTILAAITETFEKEASMEAQGGESGGLSKLFWTLQVDFSIKIHPKFIQELEEEIKVGVKAFGYNETEDEYISIHRPHEDEEDSQHEHTDSCAHGTGEHEDEPEQEEMKSYILAIPLLSNAAHAQYSQQPELMTTNDLRSLLKDVRTHLSDIDQHVSVIPQSTPHEAAARAAIIANHLPSIDFEPICLVKFPETISSELMYQTISAYGFEYHPEEEQFVFLFPPNEIYEDHSEVDEGDVPDLVDTADCSEDTPIESQDNQASISEHIIDEKDGSTSGISDIMYEDEENASLCDAFPPSDLFTLHLHPPTTDFSAASLLMKFNFALSPYPLTALEGMRSVALALYEAFPGTKVEILGGEYHNAKRRLKFKKRWGEEQMWQGELEALSRKCSELSTWMQEQGGLCNGDEDLHEIL